MEEQFNERDLFTEKLIKEAGLEKPSLHFVSDVMSAIKAKENVIAYEPLISRKVWWILAALSILVTALIYFYPMASTMSLDSLNLMERISLDVSIPEVHLSRITGYALGFLSLFLLEIPFLKRLIIKKT